MKRNFILILLAVVNLMPVVATDIELTSVSDLTTGYFIMAFDDGGTYKSPYWPKSGYQNVEAPAESAIICNGADYYYLFKAEAITYGGEQVYRVSISNGLHELYPNGIGGAAYLNSAGWCFFAGQSEPTGKSHVYGQDADGLGLWRITYTAGKGFQFQCVGNDKYISYTMSNSSSADKYYWRCFAEGSLYDAEALKVTPAYAEYTHVREMLEAWLADGKNINCEEAARTALSEALAQAATVVDAATTVDAIQSAIDGLRTAALSFLSEADIKEGSQADATWLITNPSFETGALDGWVAGKPSKGGDVGVKKSEEQYETANTDGFYLFNTWSVSDSYVYGSQEQFVQQTLQNMPSGQYRLQALASSNTYSSANTPVELFAGSYATSFVPQSKSTFKETYEVTFYLMPTEKNLTIGIRSASWFRADNFRLAYCGRTSAYEQQRRMAVADSYEKVASQALDRSSYDAVLTDVRQALLAEDVTDEEIAHQNALLREALMQLIKTGTTATGQFDLTSLLKSTNVVRANDITAVTTLTQTLTEMPAGHYTFCANAFFRPAPIAEALEMNEAGTEDHPAFIILGRSQAAVANVFDDARHAVSSPDEVLATVDGRGAPTSDANALVAFAKGDYSAVVESDLAADGSLTCGFRIRTPRNSSNGFIADRLQLLYGATPVVSINKSVEAGKLTPLCVPFEMKSDDTSQLYCVGGIEGSKAVVFPVATVHAGEPCVVSATENISGFEVAATQVCDKQADSMPLPWDGGVISADLKNYTWTATSVDGKTTTKAENLTFVVADPLNMDFTVNLENLQARRFLELEDYTATTSTHIDRYNTTPPARRDIPNNVGVPLTITSTSRLKLVLSEDEEMSQKTNIAARQTDGKLLYIPNLVPQRTYYYEVFSGSNLVGKGKFHTDGRLRMIYSPSIDNIRDLGGWRTTDGKRIRYERIYRGGELNGSHEATTAAVKRLRELGITAEIDLRIDYEQSSGKSAFGFSTDAGNFYFANAMDCYAENLTSEECYARWKAEFDLIMTTLRKGGNIYFHCRIGADRTGLLSLMLEGLLGVPRDLSDKNYELTTLSPSGRRVRSTQDAFFNYFNSLRGTTLQQKFNTFFIDKLGVSQADIDEFRSIMLEEDSANAIEDIPAAKQSQATTDSYFDLAGRRVSAALLTKGIYIYNGKKVMMK